MMCQKCKRDAPAGASYCPWCGARLQTVERKHRYHTRPNGSGTAVKRGKTWTARVVLRYDLIPDTDPPRKKAVYRTKGGFKSRKDALDYCVTLKSASYNPKGPAPQLVDYWNTYEKGELEALSKSKQVAYKGAWKKIKEIHYRPVDQLTVAEIRACVAQAETTYYTARDCKAVLTRLFSLAGADGWCSKDLPSYIVLPKLEEKERQVFSDTEQSALWKLYEAGDLRAAIPLLMICTGMMPGEMQALRVDHIDLEGHKITGAGLKTKVRRESAIYLPDDVLPMVEDLISHAQPSGYLWKRNEDAWYADYYAALAAAGCRRLEPYCCRHTTATRLAINNMIAPQTIKRVMRWSSTKMLDRYAHPDETDVLRASNTLNKMTE